MATFYYGSIYTILPFYSNGTDVFTNDIKSFTDYDAAEEYALKNIDAKYFQIIENKLN